MSNQYKKVIATNKRARFEYFIEETFEAGINLLGSEVKSVRAGKVNIADAHAAANGNEIFIYNCHIDEYSGANQFNHETKRPRRLLLHKREIKKIIGKIKIKGYSLIALSLYFNEKSRIKLELGLGKGKKLHDKRQSIKEKDSARQMDRALKEKS